MESHIEELLDAWNNYLDAIADWEALVSGVPPIQTGCGPVYELVNPLDRPNESFQISDMRGVSITEPHYHPEETEVYIVLQGTGLIVVGGEEMDLMPGVSIVTLPNVAHFTVPKEGLVMAVINTPPFQLKNYVALTESDHQRGYEKAQFEDLTPTDN